MSSKGIHLNGGPKHDEYLNVPLDMYVLKIYLPFRPLSVYTEKDDEMEFVPVTTVLGTYSEVKNMRTSDGIQEFEWDGWKV